MATSYSPSAVMVRTARNEIDRVERALTVTEQRRSALLAQAVVLDEEAQGYARRLQLLRELVEVEGATPTAEVGSGTPTRVARALKGRELRREAARLLWGWNRAKAIHYREWFERVLAAGYAIGAKDPAASFLTNVRDSPAVVGAEGQGFYRLDPSSVERVDQDICEVEAELADAERRLRGPTSKAARWSGVAGSAKRSSNGCGDCLPIATSWATCLRRRAPARLPSPPQHRFSTRRRVPGGGYLVVRVRLAGLRRKPCPEICPELCKSKVISGHVARPETA